MSCWKQTKLETLSNIETEFFMEALDKMGYNADFSKKKIERTYERDSNAVDCVICDKNTGKSINVGMRFSKDDEGKINMTICADWYYSSASERSFREQFTIEYNTIKYQQIASEMNFNTESVETLADGRRRIVMVRAA